MSMPLYYHTRNRVRILETGQIAYVTKTVEAGAAFRCPHCNKALTIEHDSTQRYGYYLTVPYPSMCCVPFNGAQLLSQPERGDYSFSVLIDRLKRGRTE